MTTYTFDGAGNQRTTTDPTGGITTNVWDDENRRTRVLLPTGVIDTSVYNGEGLRVEKHDSQGVTRFVWDFQNYLMELNAAGARKYLYTHTPDQYGLLLARTGINAFFPRQIYEFDALGSVTRLMIGFASTTATYLYKAFGETTRLSGTEHSPFAWVGQLGYYYDLDTGEYNMRERDYGPLIARFLSQDPFGFAAGDPNWFRYVFNNAINAVDPSGRFAWIPICCITCAGTLALTIGAPAATCLYYGLEYRDKPQGFIDDTGTRRIGWDAVWAFTLDCMGNYYSNPSALLVAEGILTVASCVCCGVGAIKTLIPKPTPPPPTTPPRPPIPPAPITVCFCPNPVIMPPNPIGPPIEQCATPCWLIEQTIVPPCWCTYNCGIIIIRAPGLPIRIR